MLRQHLSLKIFVLFQYQSNELLLSNWGYCVSVKEDRESEDHQCYQRAENYFTVFSALATVEVEWQLTSSTAFFFNHTISSHIHTHTHTIHVMSTQTLSLTHGHTLYHMTATDAKEKREAFIFTHETRKSRQLYICAGVSVCLQSEHTKREKKNKMR